MAMKAPQLCCGFRQRATGRLVGSPEAAVGDASIHRNVRFSQTRKAAKGRSPPVASDSVQPEPAIRRRG